ncbi:hypothetical protein ACIHCQ_40280 [Streptomyces sp. NPDC052236]|uniref:hypothetical protein n=1 Tax=Streptomyces sp. NPDC052236 TaxID=3365686 RepID=UPI0037D7C5B4
MRCAILRTRAERRAGITRFRPQSGSVVFGPFVQVVGVTLGLGALLDAALLFSVIKLIGAA